MSTAPIARASGSATAAGGAQVVSQILGMGAHLPSGVLSNADLERLVETSDDWIVERTGIRERRRACPGETASTMGAAAARAALEEAGLARPDLIITASCSTETRLPSTACLIQQHLGLVGMPAFDINAACTGFIYALVLADSLIRSRTAGTVLVVAAEALTPLVDYTDRSTCVLFGDGAAAAVVGAGSGQGGIRAARWEADGGEAGLIRYGRHADDADPEGRRALRMAGKGTFRLAVERMSDVAARLLGDLDWSGDDIDLFVPHQANARIIEAVARRLGVSMDKVFVNVSAVGNTSAASIPIALCEAVAAGRLRPGDRVLCTAFGSGLTWGGVALEWTGSPRR
ncbi:MAG: beta-ketoacyl-ACP synthase 3 [Candidatus Dormibacteria bacterium]